MDVFNMTHSAIQQGAVGVDMGRNIWQNDNPVAVLRAIRAIVHENESPEIIQEKKREVYENAMGEDEET